MNLLIISNMAHYYRNGELVGHGPTAREISYLSQLFDSVTHIGCLYSEVAPDLALPYESNNIEFVPVPPAGGEKWLQKLAIVRYIPLYLWVVYQHLHKADVVHVRAPANISLLTIVLLSLVTNPKKQWIKYAGNWHPSKGDPISYRFQRWWLAKNFTGAEVTVNGEWANSPKHIHSFYNPCLTEHEVIEGREAAATKVLTLPLRFVFVGRTDESKGLRHALRILAQLSERLISFHFDIIGDSPTRPRFEQLSKQLGIDQQVTFHGWKQRHKVNLFYRDAHFILFPSFSEGWPKVISEAMAYGVVPLTSDVSSIPQYLHKFETGKAFSLESGDYFLNAILGYVDNPDTWKRESTNSLHATQYFTYAYYLEAVKRLLEP